MRHQFIIYGLFIFTLSQGYAAVNFSVVRGYYADSIQLTLSSTLSNSQIIYTTDNSKPTLTNGLIYDDEPISISSSKTIKAVSINATDIDQVVAHTYIFLKDILQANYMDTSITKSEQYESLMEESFLSLPVISISSDLITVGENFEPDVEAAVELFNINNETAFQVNCGIETWGGSKFNLKKHYRLEFKTKYGADELEYPLFDDINYPIKPVQNFNRLLLRSGSQDGLNCEFCDESKALFIRTRVMMDLQMQMGYTAPHGRFVHVFINQQYEGVYHLMERPDQDFFQDYYFNDIAKSEIEVRKNSGFWQAPIYPTLYHQLEEVGKSDLSDVENYVNLTKHIDVEQTAAYLLLNDYGGNFDWSIDRNNLGAAAATHPYKFILWDVDLTLNNEGVFEETYGDQLSFNSLGFTGPIPELIVENENFKLQLADAMQCNCFENGALQAQQVEAVFTKRANQIEKALIAESARWGNVDFEFNGSIGHQQNNNWDVYDEWVNAKNETLKQFIANRTDTLIAQYQAAGIFPLIQAVQFVQENNLFLQEKIELINPNEIGEIYYTTNGQDPRSFNSSVAESAILYDAPITVSKPTSIKARVFADSVWSAMCPKKYYPTQAYKKLIINEIHFQPLDSITSNSDTIVGKHFEFIELYNKGTEAIDLTDVNFSDGIQYQFKNNAVIESEEYIVIASDSLMFIDRYGFFPFGVYQGNLSNEGETIQINNPFNESIQEISYALDFPWQSAFNQLGHSLSLKQVDLYLTEPSNWMYSTETGGTPGKINFMGTSISNIDNKDIDFVTCIINPFSKQLTIISIKQSLKSLQIYTVQNQLVYTQTIPINEAMQIIDYGFLSSGLYVFVLSDETHLKFGKMVR